MDPSIWGSYALMILNAAVTLLPLVGLLIYREHQRDLRVLSRLRR